MKQQIDAIVLACCADQNEISANKIDLSLGLDAPLYGAKGVLDSLGLVSLLVALEQSVEDELDVIITLADARAASQQNSPFRSVGSLSAYALQRVEEERGSNG